MEDATARYNAVYHFRDDHLFGAFIGRIPHSQLVEHLRSHSRQCSRRALFQTACWIWPGKIDRQALRRCIRFLGKEATFSKTCGLLCIVEKPSYIGSNMKLPA